MNSLSLQKKFMLIVGGTIALMLFVTAIIVVNYVGNSAQQKIEQDVANLVELEAHSVERFFALYGGVAKTFLSSPFVRDFFYEHTERGNSDRELLEKGDIYQLFKNISQNDDIVKSAFFGSALTGEYFYEPGRVGVDTEGPDAGDPDKGYFTYKRGWFSTAVKTGKLYVTPPAVDSQDGSVSAVIQSPVTHKGKLIGVGGVDILISTVGDVIDGIQYNGHGTAFLIDDNQNIVYFPDQGVELTLSSPLSSFDTVFNNTSGFSDLTSEIKKSGEGMTAVTWRGESYIAVFKHATLQEPQMDWTLGILIPESLITDPISDASTTAAIVSVIIIGVIVLITYLTGAKITQPILRMKDAMADIASGDGDLTKRLQIDSQDEIGQLATEFNRFTDKLRVLLKETAAHTHSVADTAIHFKQVSGDTSSHVKEQRNQLDNVSAAVTEMAATVIEISGNAAQSSEAASEADKLVAQGAQQAKDAMSDIRALADAVTKGVEVVSGLSKESDSIGAVIDVINSIAEQTNLLALNAAIEAARAGEQGRGFAVVADEVRSLASRTQDSTDDIRKMVERLQSMAEETDSVMALGKAQSLKGVERTEEVATSLEQIKQAIGRVQVQSEHIARATEQQTIVAEDINQALVKITGLSETTSEHADELAIGATQLSGVSNELRQLVAQFRV